MYELDKKSYNLNGYVTYLGFDEEDNQEKQDSDEENYAKDVDSNAEDNPNNDYPDEELFNEDEASGFSEDEYDNYYNTRDKKNKNDYNEWIKKNLKLEKQLNAEFGSDGGDDYGEGDDDGYESS